MADFKGWALQYVLADEEASRRDAVAKTMTAINAAPAKSTAVLHWIQSIDPWMPSSAHGDGPSSRGDEEGEGEVSIITRAKALEFLADTLELMGSDLLRADQVNLLVVFFGRLFSLDHKAGIAAAAKALNRLAAMKAFKPEMADTVIQSVASMRDDFRLQPPQTRLLIYALIKGLLADPLASSQLQHTYGSSGGFALDLLQLCSFERDPSCLVSWFSILQHLATEFELSEDLQGEIFKALSAYFPISMRSTVSPAGITVEDLKTSLRACFAASDGFARLALPFLIEKLDRGDSITTSVKVDILRTLKHCIQKYQRPASCVAPFTDRIWNSLKYEVRNGEVEETIEGALDVIRTISLRLSTSVHAPGLGEPVVKFTNLVLEDCLDDLANPTYTKQAGRLLEAVLGAQPSPFVAMVPRILVTIGQNLREPRTVEHAQHSLELMTILLDTRARLVHTHDAVGSTGLPSPALDGLFELDSQTQELCYTTYTRFWRENQIDNLEAENVTVLKEAAKGLASLVCQPGRSATMLCDASRSEQICAMLSDRIVNIFHLSSAPDSGLRKELADNIVLALQRVVLVYTDGYAGMLSRAIATLLNRDWGSSPSRKSLAMLKTLLSRLAYIGCSDIPGAEAPTRHLNLFAGSVLQLLLVTMDRAVSMDVATTILSGIFAALMNFRDACVARGLQKERYKISVDWRACISSFADSHPEFLLVCGDSAPRVDGLSAEPARIFRDYLECGLYLVVRLYQRATVLTETSPPRLRLGPDFVSRKPADSLPHVARGVAPPISGDPELGPKKGASLMVDSQDAYLHRLAEMATFVLRDLTDKEQESMRLAAESGLLFRLSDVSDPWISGDDNGRTNVLSLGILLGLWPTAMTSMLTSGSVSRYILSDELAADSFHERTQKVRDRVVAVLANKWIPKATIDGQRRNLWRETVQSISRSLREAPDLGMERYARVLAFVAGAVTRRDKEVDDLVTQISAIPESSAAFGELMARCLEDLVSTEDHLSAENHGVVKPLYQQWVYMKIIRPKLKQAFPFVQDVPGAKTVTITVLHVTKHLDFSIFEEDIGSIVRLLIAGLTALPNPADIEAALQVLRKILTCRSAALRDQLKAVVAGATRTLGLGLHQQISKDPAFEAAWAPGAITHRFLKPGNPAHCRRLVLVLLEELAQSFDSQILAPHSAQLSRVLTTACGDPVREVRQCAMAARRAWAKIGR